MSPNAPFAAVRRIATLATLVSVTFLLAAVPTGAQDEGGLSDEFNAAMGLGKTHWTNDKDVGLGLGPVDDEALAGASVISPADREPAPAGATFWTIVVGDSAGSELERAKNTAPRMTAATQPPSAQGSHGTIPGRARPTFSSSEPFS